MPPYLKIAVACGVIHYKDSLCLPFYYLQKESSMSILLLILQYFQHRQIHGMLEFRHLVKLLLFLGKM